MPDWLMEGDTATLLLIFVAALCAGVAWWKTRRKELLAGALFLLVIGGAFIALDFAFESDREQIERKVHEVAEQIKMPLDLNKMFEHISPAFRYRGFDKTAFREYCDAAVRREEVRRFVIWDYRTASLSREKKDAQVFFQFKVETNRQRGPNMFLCRADFVLDPGDQWRLRTFEIYPGNMADAPLEIPNWR
jgi:hypothetical protein